jgi:hypothetical protein
VGSGKGSVPTVAAGPMAIRDADRTTSVTELEAQPQSGKALAVWLYNIGACSLDETQAAFDRRPSWRPE